jgi:hypothetical protein
MGFSHNQPGNSLKMKKSNLPHSFQKHRVIHDPKRSREDLISYGELFMKADQVMDAAAFFTKAQHQEGIDQLKKTAREQGDSFLFKVLVQGLPGEGKREEWEALGSRAMELGKYSHAVSAFGAAENEEARKRAQEELEKLCSQPKNPEQNVS